MTIEQALALPYEANTTQEEEWETYESMQIDLGDGRVVHRWEDGTAFLEVQGVENNQRLSWGRNDPMNPDRARILAEARKRRVQFS